VELGEGRGKSWRPDKRLRVLARSMARPTGAPNRHCVADTPNTTHGGNNRAVFTSRRRRRAGARNRAAIAIIRRAVRPPHGVGEDPRYSIVVRRDGSTTNILAMRNGRETAMWGDILKMSTEAGSAKKYAEPRLELL
jgi:hypothetical protein